jgi:hypothetical protein
MAKKNAIVTLAIGDFYERMGRLTHPFMKSYAERCDAQFVVIDKPMVQARYGLTPRYDKFQVHGLLESFDRIAFFDTDVLVALDAPSVFEIVPKDVFGAASEEGFSQAKTDKVQTQQVLGPVEWTCAYFNSGVMVFGQAHKALFDPADPQLKRWASGEFRDIHGPDGADQAYLNHKINDLKLPLLDLGFRFNHTRVIQETHTRFRSHIIHYSGSSGHRYGDRLSQIAKDANVLRSSARLQLSRSFPRFRWLADRLDVAFLKYLVQERFARKQGA